MRLVGNLRRYRAHYDVIIMQTLCIRLLCESPEMSQTSGGLEIREMAMSARPKMSRKKWLEVVASEIYTLLFYRCMCVLFMVRH